MLDAITQHMDVWTSAQLTKSTAGRGKPSPAGEGWVRDIKIQSFSVIA
ncbi:hypothetical protein [Methylosoma difficile]